MFRSELSSSWYQPSCKPHANICKNSTFSFKWSLGLTQTSLSNANHSNGSFKPRKWYAFGSVSFLDADEQITNAECSLRSYPEAPFGYTTTPWWLSMKSGIRACLFVRYNIISSRLRKNFPNSFPRGMSITLSVIFFFCLRDWPKSLRIEGRKFVESSPERNFIGLKTGADRFCIEVNEFI